MAEAQGVSKSAVNRLWQLHNIKPHLHAVAGCAVPGEVDRCGGAVSEHPPEKALVLYLDEKRPIQALDRTQPGPPLKKDCCGSRAHDTKRNGTTTLVGALSVLDGQVIGEGHGRHWDQAWPKFLRRLDGGFPPQLKLHLVMDNYGTHKEPLVQAWLKQHPRFVCHFVPTRSSRLNLAQRWFRELTEKSIRYASFMSVPDLKQAIKQGIPAHLGPTPQPFLWTASVGQIIERISRARIKREQNIG